MTTQPIHDRERGPIRRETFLSGRDVLDRIRGLLSRLGDVLAEASEREVTPAARAVFEILERERALVVADTLSEFEQTAPAATTQRMHQYSISMPSNLLEPPKSPSPDALAAWTSATIDRFSIVFDELASGCESDRVAEPFELLATRMRAHARRISRISAEALEAERSPRGQPSREEQGVEQGENEA